MVKASEIFASAYPSGALKSALAGRMTVLADTEIASTVVGPIAGGISRFRVARRARSPATPGRVARGYYLPKSISTRRRFRNVV